MKKLVYFIKLLNMYLLILTSAISLTLNCTLFYKHEINKLDLVNATNLSEETLYTNYKYLIKYLNSSKSTKLSIPDFKHSYNGEYHFQEVRYLVHINYILNVFSLIMFIFFIIYSKKNKLKNNLKIPLIVSILFPFFFLGIFFINFNWFFNLFHKILFNNNYWIFNTSTDPVINMLPENFFMDVFILALIVYEILCFIIFYIANKFNNVYKF